MCLGRSLVLHHRASGSGEAQFAVDGFDSVVLHQPGYAIREPAHHRPTVTLERREVDRQVSHVQPRSGSRVRRASSQLDYALLGIHPT